MGNANADVSSAPIGKAEKQAQSYAVATQDLNLNKYDAGLVNFLVDDGLDKELNMEIGERV